MFHFTKEEKTILFLVAVVCATGSILHYALRRYPVMRDAIYWMDQDAIYPKLDINTASSEDLVRLPSLGEYTARRIVEYRAINGRFQSLEELRLIPGIKQNNWERFVRFLKIAPDLPKSSPDNLSSHDNNH